MAPDNGRSHPTRARNRHQDTAARSLSKCIIQADRAKTRRHIKRCPNFAVCDDAEPEKSRKWALCAAIRSVASSFRTVCKNSALADSGRKSGSFERSSTGRSRPGADIGRHHEMSLTSITQTPTGHRHGRRSPSLSTVVNSSISNKVWPAILNFLLKQSNAS